MPIIVKLVPYQGGYKAKIVSGYRAGHFLCHGLSDTPIVWRNPDDDKARQQARQWLTDTGYTVQDGFTEAFQNLINAVASTSIADVGDAYYQAVEAFKQKTGTDPLTGDKT